MEQNRIAQTSALTPEAATDEPASSFNPSTPPTATRALAPGEPDEFEFATDAEADAYWAGVSDGIRNGGGNPPPRLAARARDAYPELVATAEQLRDRDILDFDPVSVRHRIDGWTPQKQREYVEALADSGVARYAAARVGMSEQSANRLRRRADARSFDRACEAAARIGGRRVVSVAFERAIEGTIKRHYYHGEVKFEERVYDNRLLIALIGKLGPLIAPPGEADPVAQNWEPWMQAVEQGLPEPPPAPAACDADGADPAELELEDEEEDEFTGEEVWQQNDGSWWTSFPPPDGFDGEEQGEPGDWNYQRTLTAAEQAVMEEDVADELARSTAREAARRDRYFGFTKDEDFSTRGCEPCET